MVEPTETKEDKGDEVLRRMLKMPPDHKAKGDDKSRRPKESDKEDDDSSNA